MPFFKEIYNVKVCRTNGIVDKKKKFVQIEVYIDEKEWFHLSRVGTTVLLSDQVFDEADQGGDAVRHVFQNAFHHTLTQPHSFI